MKTLAIVLSETRAHELTYDGFKKNFLDQVNADLCVCIGIKPDYDYDNPFYKNAKYRFLYEEPDDFADAFNKASDEILKNVKMPLFEKLENVNCLHGKAPGKFDSPDGNIKYLGEFDNLDNFNFEAYKDYDEIVYHNADFPDQYWKKTLFAVKKSDHDKFVPQKDVMSYRKPLPWKRFMHLPDQFMGGVKNDGTHHHHHGSAGILIFFRWFLLQKLKETNLINEYDRFIITRSDFIYAIPHPRLELLDPSKIWFPNGEYYGGYTDRHTILNKNHIEQYLKLFTNMVLRSNQYFSQMQVANCRPYWNLERLIKFHLNETGVYGDIREYPYVTYSIRNHGGVSRWQWGWYSHEHGYYIKYNSEYTQAIKYKEEFEKSNKSVDEFYKDEIKKINPTNDQLVYHPM